MKESVDNKLKEHIIEVFDRYDDGDAELGWQKLRRKYPAKPHRRVAIWWSSVAAVLILAGVFYFNRVDRKDASEPAKVAKNKPADSIKNNSTNDYKNPKATFHSRDEIVEKSDIASITGNNKTTQHFINPNLTARQSAGTSFITQPDSNVVQIQRPVVMNREDALTLPSHANQILVQDSLASTSGFPLAASGLMPDHLLSERKGGISVAEEATSIKSAEKNHRKFQLGFYAGPFFNYAEGSGSTMNLGAGVTSDITLNKRFTLITGLALAKNTLIFRDELPATSYVAFNSSVAQSSLIAGSAPQISRLEAHLFNLDVPLNLKYSISREANKIFVTAGLSSFTYLNEAYRYSYNNNSNNGATFSSRDEVLNKDFGKFDLAQTLNLSFGLTHKAKYQDLVIEPFLKYPLGDLGSQNLRFGSAGINLRLNIKPGNK
jgi:hypothetical protein